MKFLAHFARFLVTLAVVALAVFAGTRVWTYYVDEPWTRDGTVSADVVGVAPDVSGLVADVLVHDNETVKRGDILFRVDPVRFQLALEQAAALVQTRLAAMQEAAREEHRAVSLPQGAVSQQGQQQALAAFQQATGTYQQALADEDVAKLNLQRATVTAPVNGIITNFSLRPGDYVTAGHAVTALVDTDSLRVDGYFEETKLPKIRVGEIAYVQLMGTGRWLTGHVASIAGGVEDPNVTSGANLLADVNPTFNWVRLAQRIPVRIRLDDPPPSVRLIAGRTATVWVGKAEDHGHPFALF
jgi:RND family efflux transporter MFP subunit